MSKEAFVFPGQGSQYVGMGKPLLENPSLEIAGISKLTYEEASDVSGINLAELCLVGPKQELDRTRITQPAILTTSIAALRVLHYLNRNPDIVAGHSLGEFSAFVAAKSLTFEQAVRIVKARGEFMELVGQKNPGSMVALIGLSLEEVEAICLQTGAEVANVNEETQIVISGKKEALQAASSKVRESGKKAFPLVVSIASHSSLMAEAKESMQDFMGWEMVFNPKIPLILNLTGNYARSAKDVEEEIVEQLTGRVLWLQSVKRMSEDGADVITEVGPRQILSKMTKRIFPEVAVYSSEDLIYSYSR